MINDITYAQVYPNPIHFPTNPQVDIVDNTLRLLGYRWQTDDKQLSTIHLIWENLGDQSPSVAVRLWRNKAQHSDWLICTVASGFTEAAQTSGEVVESECLISDLNLLPDLYTLQVGVQTNQKPVLSTVAKQPGVEVSKTQNPKSTWQTLDFAAGWSTIEVTQNGTLHKVSPEIAFAQQATEALPASATRLEHTYYDHIRLLAYEVEPGLAQSGQAITVNLYWQAQRFIDREADASLQLFTTNHQQVANVNGTPLGGFNTRPTSTWQPGEVIHDVWTLDIPLDTPTPIQLRLDVGLFLPDTLTPLPVRNLAGEDIPAAVGTLRLEPETWPSYQGQHPSNTIFADTIQLIGYDMNNNEITLYWQTLAQPNTDYTAFVHALNRKGTLVAQSDIPAGGLFPTSAWQPGNVVLSRHTLTNEVVLDGLQLFVGLYGPDGVRLPVTNKEPGQDTVLIQ